MTTETLVDTVNLAIPVEAQHLASQGQELVRAAESLTITDADSFAYAGEVTKKLRSALKRAEEILDPFVESAHKSWKSAVAHRDGLKAPYLTARKIVDGKMEVWDREQAQIRHEAEAAARREQERLEQEAREVAAAETRRLQAEAETRRLEEAAALEARGDTLGAERLIAEPVVVSEVAPAPVFVQTPPSVAAPKVVGISFREDWSAEVTDLGQLVRAIAAGHTPNTLVVANQTALNQMARALKGAMNVPGVKSISKRVTAGRV